MERHNQENPMRKLVLGALVFLIMGIAGLFSAQATDRHVKIFNDTSNPMTAFYASRRSSTSWEENIIRRNGSIASGDSVNVNIDDGSGACVFDMRAEFRGGRWAEKRGFNVCTGETWTIYDGD